MQSSDIIMRSDNRSKNRAQKQNITAKLYKVEDNKIIYTVTSSHHDKQYLVTFLLLGLTGNKLKSLQSALNSDLKISCSCDAFLFQGYKYITWKNNTGINKETRPPNKTNPAQKGMACKHILVALEQMKKDYKQIYELFKEQVKKDKVTHSDIADNDNSNSVTDVDIQTLDAFKKACDKLYSDYTSYLKSDHGEVQFVDSDAYDKTDPSEILSRLSKPAQSYAKNKFVSKLTSLDNILKQIDQKKSSFNILLNSDISSLTRKFNSVIGSKTESLINNIILSLMGHCYE